MCRLPRLASFRSIKQLFCFHFQFSSSNVKLLLEVVPYPEVVGRDSCHFCTFSVDSLTRSTSGSDMSVSRRDMRKRNQDMKANQKWRVNRHVVVVEWWLTAEHRIVEEVPEALLDAHLPPAPLSLHQDPPSSDRTASCVFTPRFQTKKAHLSVLSLGILAVLFVLAHWTAKYNNLLSS